MVAGPAGGVGLRHLDHRTHPVEPCDRHQPGASPRLDEVADVDGPFGDDAVVRGGEPFEADERLDAADLGLGHVASRLRRGDVGLGLAGGRLRGRDPCPGLVDPGLRRLVLVGRLVARLGVDDAAADQPGDAVVLSPGCASFDWYSGYPARGDDFRRLVTAHLAASTVRSEAG